jgi:hypothetical protein
MRSVGDDGPSWVKTRRLETLPLKSAQVQVDRGHWHRRDCTVSIAASQSLGRIGRGRHSWRQLAGRQKQAERR